MNLAGKDNVKEYISASAITDIYYIANRQIKNKSVVKKMLKQLLYVVSITSVTENEIKMALSLDWNDFEDSVQYSVALLNEMDGIITRNPKDYKQSKIPVWLPTEILGKLN